MADRLPFHGLLTKRRVVADRLDVGRQLAAMRHMEREARWLPDQYDAAGEARAEVELERGARAHEDDAPCQRSGNGAVKVTSYDAFDLGAAVDELRQIRRAMLVVDAIESGDRARLAAETPRISSAQHRGLDLDLLRRMSR